MSTDQPTSPGTPPDGKTRRRPPTIELTATEIAAGAAGADRASADAAHGASPRRFAWLPSSLPWPLIGAGAAVGAVIVLVLAGLFARRDAGVEVLDARLARLEQQMREIAARPLPPGADTAMLDDVRSRLARLEAGAAAQRPAAADPALAGRAAAFEAEVKALREAVAALGRRGDEIAVTARDARARGDANAAALSELAQKAARSVPTAVGKSELEAALARAIEPLAERVAAVERGEKAVEAELARRPAAAGDDRAARLALAASALEAALARGDPLAAELAAVKALGADPKSVAALEPFAAAGVPSAGALVRELSALAPALLGAAGVPPRDGGFLDRLQVSAEKLVRIRPIDEVAGSDPAAIVARAEAKAAKTDLAGALAELAKLPAEARAPAQAWIGKAQLRAAALDAGRRIAAAALTGLSK